VLTGGHEIVTGTLGGGGGEDGRGDLKEVVGEHGGAERGDDVAAKDDVLLDGGVAQVKIAVLQTLGLVGLAAAVDLEGQLVVAAAAEDFHLRGDNFDVAGGLLGVLAGALADGALDGNGGLLVEALDELQRCLVFNDDLGRAVEVTQNHESEVRADFADVFHPADELDLLADVLHAEGVTIMGTGLHHGKTTPVCIKELK